MELLRNIPFDKYLISAGRYADENIVFVGAGTALIVFFGGYFIFKKNDLQRDGLDYDAATGGVRLLKSNDHTLGSDQFNYAINDYEKLFDGARQSTGTITNQTSVDVRKEKYAKMIDHFYNIVTDFYEYGWGQSFHFAPRWRNESFLESIRRAEYFLASKLKLNDKMKAVDVGCGVGGPMRNIAIFSGAEITGISINQYQVNIGNKYNKNIGLSDTCKLICGDFQNLPWPEATFDAAYEIEATCHSPDRVVTFAGVNRILRTGALFAGYEWVMTDKYDPNNREHVRIKEGIEVGNALPTLVHYKEVLESLEKAGFKIVESYDANRGLHDLYQIPWYETLTGKFSFSGFRMTHVGRMCTHSLVWFLETIRVAPEGSTKISALLNATALDLVDGGKQEIFTPSFYFLAEKV